MVGRGRVIFSITFVCRPRRPVSSDPSTVATRFANNAKLVWPYSVFLRCQCPFGKRNKKPERTNSKKLKRFVIYLPLRVISVITRPNSPNRISRVRIFFNTTRHRRPASLRVKSVGCPQSFHDSQRNVDRIGFYSIINIVFCLNRIRFFLKIPCNFYILCFNRRCVLNVSGYTTISVSPSGDFDGTRHVIEPRTVHSRKNIGRLDANPQRLMYDHVPCLWP